MPSQIMLQWTSLYLCLYTLSSFSQALRNETVGSKGIFVPFKYPTMHSHAQLSNEHMTCVKQEAI